MTAILDAISRPPDESELLPISEHVFTNAKVTVCTGCVLDRPGADPQHKVNVTIESNGVSFNLSAYCSHTPAVWSTEVTD